MKIPVFVSCPTALSKAQEAARKIIVSELDQLGMEQRALGRTDYPSDFPLREILVLAVHCSGGIILGFEQFLSESGVAKRGTTREKTVDQPTSFPTPWNQIEAGILFTIGLPLIVFMEEGISGGVFDTGVTDVYLHKMPMGRLTKDNKTALREVFLNWQRKVRSHYYGD
jgi:hypothetical protein